MIKKTNSLPAYSQRQLREGELEKQRIIKKIGKKIFVVRDTLYSAKAVDTLTEVANMLYEFNKILKKEKLVTEVYSVKEIILAIKENFSYCLYQFNNFWFICFVDTTSKRATKWDSATCCSSSGKLYICFCIYS